MSQKQERLILQTMYLLLFISVSQAQLQDQIPANNKNSFCDSQTTQQLQQQNIDYECVDNNIILQNKLTIELDLNLVNFQTTSKIIFENCNQVKLNKVYLSNLKMEKYFGSLIQLRNINNLQIQNFTAEFSRKNEDLLNLIYFYQVQVTQIGCFLVYSEQEGLDNHYQFLINSQNLYFKEILFLNIYSISLNFYGSNQLNIDQLSIIQNSQYEKQSVFLGYSFCYYLSENQININQINVEINSIFEGINKSSIWFATIQIENSQSQNPSDINIGTIAFKSQDIQFSNLGVIQFQTEQMSTSLKIKNIFSQQIDSQYHIQIQIQKINSIWIDQLTFEGFGNSMLNNYNNNNIFFKLQNVLDLKITKIIFIKNNLVTGTLFDGNVFQLSIYSLEIQPFNNFTRSLINLQNCNYVRIEDLTVEEEVEFNDYLFTFNNLLNLHFYKFYLNKFSFKQESLFYLSQVHGMTILNFELQNVKTYNQQSAIIYVDVTNFFFETIYEYSYVQVNLKTDHNHLQFLNFYGSLYIFTIENSNIINGSSINLGGCLNFFNPIISIQQQSLKLTNTTLSQCQSKYLGGAVSGISVQFQEESQIINCSSQIGGAIYQSYYNTGDYDIKYFKNNVGFLAAANYNLEMISLRLDSIQEITSNIDGQIQLIQVDKYIYPGIMYIIKISINVDDVWYSQYNQLTKFGNIYDLVVDPTDNYIASTPENLQHIYYPYILWQAKNITFDDKQTKQFKLNQINLDYNYELDTSQYKIYNGCKDQGMEKVYLNSQNKQQFICAYCENMKVSYTGVCVSCQTDYFVECYSNYSLLRQNYWRSNYTVNTQDILFCSNNPQSCVGGSGVGNELCYQGHVGAQCLDCDIKGTFWEDQYSQVGYFQCTKCSDISQNTAKIIILLVFLAISLIIIIMSLHKRLRNELYAIYLSKMGIFFFGKTLQRQQLSSAYIKILLFHIQVFMVSNQFTQVDIISTFSNFSFLFYNPLSSPFFSLNCLISQYWPNESIGFSNILLTFLIPLSLSCLIALCPIILYFISKKYFRKSLQIAFLSFIYIFITVFDSILLEKTLSSFFCLNLEKDKSYSLIDLSLECENSGELKKIQNLSLIILIIFLIALPLVIFIRLIQQRKRLKKVRVMYTFGFLYNEYKHKFYSWEIIRFLVRYLLILFTLSLKEYPQIALIMICLLQFTYFVALQSYSPFISAFLNNLEKISIIISVISLLSSNMYLQQNQNENQSIVDFRLAFYLIIQIINLIFIIYCLFIITVSFLEQQLYKLKKYLNCRIFQKITQVDSIRINQNIKKLIRCVRQIKLSQNIIQDNTKLLK
ncbi:transmembrane protein, putative (macronuclear) [Tetrahymena thermophila SB210]|uniref:Transmembrane protein, putative n=1 Tax=Tetrahymena thermophila (strain SB210) TaxID=312017 RepID=I7LWT0_TETTS|nr:transmembrane protein, putative [Tetrahymena thermophila SB210]EAS02791.2 transmembrane protein, putative [Tetrahymena thermophila SB210]|eukprot:XP_001023036.2 transmembrane protein, putative [Tetrahymena thermophila SB210]